MAVFEDPLTRRGLLASAVMAGGLVATRAIAPPKGVGSTHFNLDAALPRLFAGWRMANANEALLPDPDEAKAVTQAYEEAVSRTYLRGGDVMMLVVAHGRPGSGLLALHRAETCYTAQGFAVKQDGKRPLPPPFADVKTTSIFAVRDDRQEPVLYWASVAGEQSATNIEQKLRLLRAAWQGRSLDAFLVRASSFGPATPAAYDRIGDFLRDLLVASPLHLRRMLAA